MRQSAGQSAVAPDARAQRALSNTRGWLASRFRGRKKENPGRLRSGWIQPPIRAGP